MSRILFCGDVFIDTNQKVSIDFDIKTDVFVFNLEYCISDEGKPAPNKINLRSTSFNLDPFLEYCDRVVVCLANNHIMDYGELAFRNTIKFLEEHGIKYFGAGYIQDNENNPCIIQVDQKKVGFLGYCCPTAHPIFSKQNKPGAARLEKKRILHDLFELRQLVDYSIVSLHWGLEEIYLPRVEDVELAHEMIDAGADLIIGHHAHAPQPIEKYSNKVIAYGLGNFAFSDLVEVPAHFNENGIPSTFICKKFEYWGKFSMGLLMDFEHDIHEIHRFLFDNFKIEETKTGFDKIIGYNVTKSNYKKCFKRHIKQRMIGCLFRGGLSNPRMPRKKHFKLIWDIMTKIDLKQ